MNYVDTVDNTVNLFLDITTVCNLNCNYCFARKEKEWELKQSVSGIRFILKTILLSPYSFNILLFGGEALAHSEINEIVNICNESTKVVNTVILTNGVIKGDYNMDVRYVFSLHDLSESEYMTFKHHCKIPESLLINMVIKDTDIFKERYLELYNLGYDIEISQIYDENVKLVEDLSDLPFLKYNVRKYSYNNELYNYRDYIKIHRNIKPKDIGICYVQELNISVSGDISNDCNNVSSNIFNNPLFFKRYRKEFNCQRECCMDCTGTIRTSKDIKGI